MCRGLALGLSKEMKVVCKGLSSHYKTLKNEDEYLKFEIIIDENNKDGYKLEMDEDYKNDSYIQKIFLEFFEDNKLKKEIYDFVYNWIKENEIKVLRWLLFNKSYGNFNNNNNNSSQKVEGNCNNSSQKVEGNCDNSFQEVKGTCDNSFQKVEGNCNNSFQEVKGTCDNSSQEVKGDIYINSIKNFKPKIDDFIEMLTKEYNYKLTWKILVKLAMKGYEKDLHKSKNSGIKNEKI
jgi:hypothetical protein